MTAVFFKSWQALMAPPLNPIAEPTTLCGQLAHSADCGACAKLEGAVPLSEKQIGGLKDALSPGYFLPQNSLLMCGLRSTKTTSSVRLLTGVRAPLGSTRAKRLSLIAIEGGRCPPVEAPSSRRLPARYLLSSFIQSGLLTKVFQMVVIVSPGSCSLVVSRCSFTASLLTLVVRKSLRSLSKT